MHDLKPFPRLDAVDFYDNSIESLPSDLFASNKKITFIYLSNNPIKSVGVDILSPLQKLKKVYFYSTACIDMGAYSGDEIDDLQAELNSQCQKPW